MARGLGSSAGSAVVGACVALGLASGGCNAVFDIEEGVLASLPPSSPDGGQSGAASQPDAGGQADAGGSAAAEAQSEPLLFYRWEMQPPTDGLELAGSVTIVLALRGISISPPCFDRASCAVDQPPRRLCVSGRSQPLPTGSDGMPDYTDHWGAALVLAVDGRASRRPGEGGGGRALGVSFEVEGQAVPAGLRFDVTLPQLPGESYCSHLGMAGHFEVRFDELRLNCFWSPGSSFPATERIAAWAWNIPADVVAFNFDFCIRDIRLILSAD